MAGIPEQLRETKGRIDDACAASGRSADSVELIAVSKTFPPEAISEAYDAGQRQFGESRLQEGEPKVCTLPREIDWHFIGRVQRNKVRRILPLFGTIHGIDSSRLARYVDRIAGELGLRPKIFLQINIGREESKGGFHPDEVVDELATLFPLTHLDLMGLMCIPPIEDDARDVKRWFAALRELRDKLSKELSLPLPALSMGMSGDFEEAIHEGATHVRVGSAIFGQRSYRVDGELG